MFTWSSRAWRQTVTWVVKASTRGSPAPPVTVTTHHTVGGSGSHREHTTLSAGFDVALHGVAHGGEHVQGFHGDGRERPVDVDLDPQALAEPGLLQRQVVPHDGELVPQGAGVSAGRSVARLRSAKPTSNSRARAGSVRMSEAIALSEL